jgi:hypothetical protein
MSRYATIILLIFFSSCYYRQPPQKTGLEGKPVPAFDFLSIDSTQPPLAINNLPQNKSIVFILFSPYCPFCRAEIKDITENMDQMKDIQFCLITRWPRRSLRKFYKEFDLDKYPNISAGVDTANYLSSTFNIVNIPYTIIYGKNRTLSGAFLGRMDVNQIKAIASR